MGQEKQKIRLQIQLPEKDLQDYVDYGFVELSEAKEVLSDFDWKKHYDIITKRNEEGIESSNIELFFTNSNEGKKLWIQVFDIGEFSVTFYDGKKQKDYDVYDSYGDDNEESNLVKIVSDFYLQKLVATDETIDTEQNVSESLSKNTIGKYNPWKHYYPLLVFFAPIFFLLFMLNKGMDEGATETLIIFSTIIIIYNSPFLFIFIQYLNKPKVQSVTLVRDETAIIVKYKNKQRKVHKSEIQELVFVHCAGSKMSWSALANISFMKKGGEVFYLTSLSFSKEELELIIKHLKINKREFKTYFQFVKSKQYFNRLKHELKNVATKDELREQYVNYSDKQLQDIISNPNEYQALAIEMAKKEIQNRKR